MGKTTGKANNSSAGRFFYSFGTVFLFAVLTICMINFTRDGRLLHNTADAPAAAVHAASDSSSAAEGTINVDTSDHKAPSKSSTGKETKPAAPQKTQRGSGTADGAAKPANPGEEP